MQNPLAPLGPLIGPARIAADECCAVGYWWPVTAAMIFRAGVTPHACSAGLRRGLSNDPVGERGLRLESRRGQS